MSPYQILQRTPSAYFVAILAACCALQIGLDLTSIASLFLIPIYFIAACSYTLLAYSLLQSKNYLKTTAAAGIADMLIKPSKRTRHQFKAAVVEEICWRFVPLVIAYASGGMRYAGAALLVSLLIFVYLHFLGLTQVPLILVAEFIGYFGTLTLLYLVWHDVLLITLAHFGRNLSISYVRASIESLKTGAVQSHTP